MKLESLVNAYLGGSSEESLTYKPGFINIDVINYGNDNVTHVGTKTAGAFSDAIPHQIT